MAAASPPYYPMDSEHRGSSIIIGSYTLIAYTVCVGIVRFTVTRQHEAAFSLDDASIIVAIVFAVVADVVYSKTVSPGLGLHQATLGSHEIVDAFHLTYIAQLLGVVAMWAAKVSSATLRWRIERNGSRRLSITGKATIFLAALWGPICLLVLAYQCRSPAWKYMGTSACSENAAMQYTVIALNMASDLWLASAAVPLIFSLHMETGRKVKVSLLMALRVIVPALAIGQFLAVSATAHSKDKTWERAVQSTWEMIVIFFSVLCSVIPRTQKFWGALQSGGMLITNTNEIELSSGGKYNLSGQSGSSNRRTLKAVRERFESVPSPQNPGRTSEDSQQQFFPPFQTGLGLTRSSITAPRRDSVEVPGNGSSARSQGNGILQTVEFKLQRE